MLSYSSTLHSHSHTKQLGLLISHTLGFLAHKLYEKHEKEEHIELIPTTTIYLHRIKKAKYV